MIEKYLVKTADLTRQCQDDPFAFTTTEELAPLDSVIGQRRAVEAIHFGLNMKGPGYHIFITGFEGTGRNTITRDILTAYARGLGTPEDLCLVNHFDDPYCPRAMELPTGSAVFFSRKMAQFIETLKVKLPQAFDQKAFVEKQDRIKKGFADTQHRLISKACGLWL